MQTHDTRRTQGERGLRSGRTRPGAARDPAGNPEYPTRIRNGPERGVGSRNGVRGARTCCPAGAQHERVTAQIVRALNTEHCTGMQHSLSSDTTPVEMNRDTVHDARIAPGFGERRSHEAWRAAELLAPVPLDQGLFQEIQRRDAQCRAPRRCDMRDVVPVATTDARQKAPVLRTTGDAAQEGRSVH